ncbi:MAG: S1-C subfamily serine protease [Planctomycetota bacterium]
MDTNVSYEGTYALNSLSTARRLSGLALILGLCTVDSDGTEESPLLLPHQESQQVFVMNRIALSTALGLFAAVCLLGLYSTDTVHLRLDEMERAANLETRENSQLKRVIVGLKDELASVYEELIRRDARIEHAETLASKSTLNSSHIENLERILALQTQQIEAVSRTQEDFDAATIESSLVEMDLQMEARYDMIVGMASTAAELASASKRQIDELGAEMDSSFNPVEMWDTLLGPIVKLSGEESVGSGVIIRGALEEGSESQVDYVLTAWHVVRDIQGSLYNRDMPVPVEIFLSETETREVTAELLEFDPKIDVAILRLDKSEHNENAARLPDHRSLAELRIFDQIYAVGCPLGNDPIPTVGQVSALSHIVDEEVYMMINAPTYVGNSGGGIFTADGRELLGIFSKVYTHGSLRPTIVTHMGLVTPMQVIYSWLEEVDYGFLVPKSNELASIVQPREASTK